MRYARKNTKDGATDCRIFDSLGDVIGQVRGLTADRLEGHDYAGAKSDVDFVGREFASRDALYVALNEAWAHGIETMERMTKDLCDADLPQPTSRRRKTRFSECDGDQLDYDRLRSGRDYWRTSRRQNTKGPATLTVIVDIGANAHVDHDDILWRGSAAVALTKLLEEAGYRVELWAVDYADHGQWENGNPVHQLNAVRLKECSEPIDASTLINAVSGWAFRTLWFQVASLGTAKIDGGLGRAAAPRGEHLDEISRDAKRVLIADAWSYEAAVELIRETLTNLTNAKENQ